MTEDAYQNLKGLLDKEHNWPEHYTFKFLTPIQKEAEVKAILPDGGETTVKLSKKGNYVSISFKTLIHHSEEVIEIYKAVELIDNVIMI